MSFDQIILMVALLAVAGILGWGVLTMARGGDYNIKIQIASCVTVLFFRPSP